ncbi:MAG: hypothetical protein ACQETE_00395 [Bacteroidota bacterium]
MLLTISGCGDSLTNSVNKIDESEIKGERIEAEAFYTLKAPVLKKVNDVVYKNRETLLREYKGKRSSKDGFFIQPISNLDDTKSKSGSTSDVPVYSVVEENGTVENITLSITNHLAPGKYKAGGDAQLSEENVWIAYNVDKFYVTEDEDGNDIWPVTIPATNLADSTI